MIKNLLVLKNELLSLDIGDQPGGYNPGAAGVATSHTGSLINNSLGHIFDTLRSSPQNLFGLLGSFSAYIPGSSLWSSSPSASRSGTPVAGGAAAVGRNSTSSAAAPVLIDDAGEQLDELLRHHIYAFTRRWAVVMSEARQQQVGGGKASAAPGAVVLGGSRNSAAGGGGGLDKAERELGELLQRAFPTQAEVVGKVKEAIEMAEQRLRDEAVNAAAGGGSGRKDSAVSRGIRR